MRIVFQRLASCIIFAAALIQFDALAVAQDNDVGRANFVAFCVEYHGADGKGKGPRSAELKTRLTDLSLLAKKNSGVFDPGAIYQIIDGRQPGSRTHLSKDMPIWGCRHQSQPLVRKHVPRHQHYFPPPVTHKYDEDTTLESLADLSCDPETTVQQRILSIVGYLSHIQR